MSPPPSVAIPAVPHAPNAGYVPALDLVRIAALAGVVLTHVIAWAGRDGAEAETWGRSIELLARSGVPCFLLLSGLLLGRGGSRSEPPGAYLQRRWLRIGAPWLAWAPLWLLAYLWVADSLKGLEPPDLQDVLVAVSFGPGYLYFLVLAAQFTVLAAFWPNSRRARLGLALVLCALQVLLGQGRLLASPESLGPLGEAIDLRAYQLAPFWGGTFALGVVAGARLPARPSRRVLGATLAVCAASGLGLLYAPDFGWWNPGRMDGARSLLHPLYLPFAASEVALLYWAATALTNRVGRFAMATPLLGEASFGVYLAHQYPLELLAPLLQDADAPMRLSDPLPGSLLPIITLYLVTLVLALACTALLRLSRLGQVITGGSTQRSVAAASVDSARDVWDHGRRLPPSPEGPRL